MGCQSSHWRAYHQTSCVVATVTAAGEHGEQPDLSSTCEVFDVRTQVLLWNNDAAKINVEVFLKKLLGEVPDFLRLYRDAAQFVGP